MVVCNKLTKKLEALLPSSKDFLEAKDFPFSSWMVSSPSPPDSIMVVQCQSNQNKQNDFAIRTKKKRGKAAPAEQSKL